MAWMKEAAARFYLKRRWMKKKKKSRLCCHTRAPNLISVSCVCWCGWRDENRGGSHQPPPAWIDTAAEPALESKHLKPKKCKAPTHRGSVHNERGITNKHGHLQTIHTQAHIDERLQRMRTWTDTCRNFISQKHAVTAMYRGSFPQTLLPPEKKGSGSAPLSRPKTCAVHAQVGVSPTVNPTHDRGHATRHVPRPNRRLSQTAGIAKRNSLPENLPRPANIPQPKLPLAQCSPQNLEAHLVEKINLHLARSAESPSVERHNAKFLTEASLADVEHSMKLQYVLPARSLLFLEVLCPEELP